ncbi:MAG: anti-sigma factor domain-containing protein, partial [Clostridia bacterium]
MKAMIVEIKKHTAVVLTDQGIFVRIRNKGYCVGQRLELPSASAAPAPHFMRLAALAACLVLILGLGAGAYSYLLPTCYVSMDVNPSIEYTLNAYHRVLAVQAVNESGAVVLADLKAEALRNCTVEEAIQSTLRQMDSNGLFDGTAQGGIVLAVCEKEEAASQQLANHLKEVVASQCAANHRNVTVQAMAVNRTQLAQATAMNVTPGKLLLAQKLMAKQPADTADTLDAWLQKPVRDILTALERAEEAEDVAEDAEDEAEDARDAAEDATEDEAEDVADVADAVKNEADAVHHDWVEDRNDAAKEQAQEQKEAAEKAAEAKKEAAEKAVEAKKEAAEKAAEAKKEAAEKAAEKAAEAKKEAAEK